MTEEHKAPVEGHTPGPWVSDEAGIVAEGWGLVCNIGLPEAYWGRGFEGDPTLAEVETMEANARLIAAAPDLLAAARKLMASIAEMDPEQRGCSTVAYAETWEAIAAATGEQS